MKPVVITGYAGFIGYELLKLVRQTCYANPIVIDRLTGDDVRYITGIPITSSIYHLAAIASVPACEKNSHEAYDNNVGGTENILKCAKASGYDKFVLASSAAVYGDTKGPLTEDSNVKPKSVYGNTKLAAEKVAFTYGNAVALRLFNVYGNTDKGVIPRFIEAALLGQELMVTGDGEQTRDFVHVEDVCKAFLSARSEEGTFNVATGRSITMNELADIIVQLCGSSSEVKHVKDAKGDIKYSEADISKILDIGWKPEMDFEAGLKGIIKWKRSSLSAMGKLEEQ